MFRIIVLLLFTVYVALSDIHPYYSGLQLGIGADASISAYYGTALEYTNANFSNTTNGQTTQWSLTVVSSSGDLNSALNLGVSASFKARGINTNDVAQFAQSCNLNQYATQLLVQVSIKGSSASILRPSLSAEAKDYLILFGLEKFQKVFGPEYLGGYIMGGTYLGIITVDTQSKSEKQTVASGVSFSEINHHLKINISDAAEAIFKKRQVEVYGVQIGGQATTIATTIQAMVDQLQAFPDQVQEHPVPIQGIFNDYETTIPFDWSGPGINYTIRNDLLQTFSNRLNNIKDRKNNLLYVLEHYDQFDELRNKSISQKTADLTQIYKEIDEIDNEKNTINNIVGLCVKNTSYCVEIAPIYSPVFQLPKLKNDLISETVGMIMSYFGEIKNIPYGWQICDGSLGTPDLRGRFALGELSFNTSDNDRVGSAESQVVGDSGGNCSKILSIEEMPSHNHYVEDNGSHSHIYYNTYFCYSEYFRDGDDGGICTYKDHTSTDGVHNHQLDNTGGGEAFEMVPPYAIVYYICKVK